MTKRGEAPPPWQPDEAARFFDAFHRHGHEFDKVADDVGGGRTAAACEALYRKQQAYLSIPKSLQSVEAFAALVDNTQKEEEAEAAAEPSRSRSQGGGEAAASGAAGSGLKLEGDDGGGGDEEDEEEDEDEYEDADEGGEEPGDDEGVDGARTLAASRARRTPKRSSGLLSPGGTARTSGRRTPLSGMKRSRGAAAGRQQGQSGGADIYEYYDEGADAISESARKRRMARRGLDFQPQAAAARRRHDADEAKGIDALLALAVAGEESALGDGETEGEEGDEYEVAVQRQQAAAAHRKQAAKPRAPKQRRQPVEGEEEEEDWEEEPADAGAMDDDAEDEDFAPPASARRNPTPFSTPAKGRLRPASAHTTPRRSGGRGAAAAAGGLAAASPGLHLRGLSPYMLSAGLDGDMLSDLGGFADLGYITSPGFPQFPPGFVPSPQNPMPRLRRRKSVPERGVPPSVASPIKSLFTRRSSLAGGPSLMHSFGYSSGASTGGAGEEVAGGGGASAAAAGGVPQTAAESQLRHCLQQPRTQRWAAAEFLYSALDRPFFMFNPLSGLLAQLGLGEDARLTRKEWALIRSGLGKPRRLSLNFLKEERVRLERWRDGCRQQYQSGAAAVADPKVADHLPRPLGVGQRVVARHPTTRQLHDGSVLTVAHNCYRVQFDRQELGVELVRDTDLMPSEPAENLPPALLGRSRMVLNGRHIINGQPVRPLPPRLPATTTLPAAAMAAAAAAAAGAPMGPAAAAAAAARLMPGMKPDAAGAAAAAGGTAQQQQQLPQQQQQARAADAKALAELVVGLDKKEALLLQLRSMNDEATAGMHTDSSGAAAPQFVNAYANVVLQLKDVNEKVQDKLEQLDKPSSGSDMATTGGAAAPPVGAAAGLQHQQLGASLAADAALQRQLQAQTPEALSAAALGEARSIIASCRSKLAESASEAAAAAAAAAASPAANGTGGGSEHGAAAQAEAEAGGSEQQAAAAAAVASPATAVSAGSSGGLAAGGGLDWSSSNGQQLGGLIEGCVHSLVLLQQGAQSNVPAATLSAALDQALAAVQPHAAANQQLYAEIQEAMKILKLQISAVAS